MANEVYANGRELACKSGQGKSTCAFPDVCFTPPQTPATPPGIPIPYPNTGMASDTTDGSKTVVITDKEVMLKNKSYFKQSTGDEAGSAPKKGVVTSVNKGKVYFNAWSMDVKFEGENVVRHLDITTHNHASFPGNSPTWPFLDAQAFSGTGPCKDVAKEVNTCCSPHAEFTKAFSKKLMPSKTKKGIKSTTVPKALVLVVGQGGVKRPQSMKRMCQVPACREAMKCVLTQKEPNNCCEMPNGKKKTPHHIVPDSQFNDGDGNRLVLNSGGTYSYGKAPCVCVDGTSHSTGTHGELHTYTNNLTAKTNVEYVSKTGKSIDKTARWTFEEAANVGVEAVCETLDCPENCTEFQVFNGHKKMGIDKKDEIRPTTAGRVKDPPNNTTPGWPHKK